MDKKMVDWHCLLKTVTILNKRFSFQLMSISLLGGVESMQNSGAVVGYTFCKPVAVIFGEIVPCNNFISS
jgi:hypothetical protein